MTMKPFGWQTCARCASLGYREPMMRQSIKWDHLDPTMPVWKEVTDWHRRIAAEMWDDYVTSDLLPTQIIVKG